MRKFLNITTHLWLYSLPMSIVLALISRSWRVALLSLLTSLGVQALHSLKWHPDEFAGWLLATTALIIVVILTSSRHLVEAVAAGPPAAWGVIMCLGVAMWDVAFHVWRHERHNARWELFLYALFFSVGGAMTL